MLCPMIVTCVKKPTGSPPRCHCSRIAVDHQQRPPAREFSGAAFGQLGSRDGGVGGGATGERDVWE